MIGPAISASGATQVLVVTKPVDFRKQADSLAALVQEALGADPFSGAVYVFRAKRADRVKLLWWDASGLCLLSKRLESSQFRWPRIEDGRLKASPKLFCDETRCPVLDPGRGKTKTGYLWAIARDDRPWGSSDPPAVVYAYAPGRGGVHAVKLLDGFTTSAPRTGRRSPPSWRRAS
jgi:transposase